MYKKLAFAFFLFCSAFNGYSIDLKKNVCIVKQGASETLKKSYEDMAKTLSNNGYFSSANALRGRGNSFGSGLVYKASDNKFYIITNRHVVGSSPVVDVEFVQEDGAKVSYVQCKVLGTTNEDDDIALVQLPAQANFPETIVPFKGQLKDGDEVWTAGYPGLGNEPTWQLGKGILSNISIQKEEFGKGNVIQHTAQVDAGNSGGPLLKKVVSTVKDGKNTKTIEAYEVIGLNTWKARFRESTNFSIPFSRAEQFADSIITKKPGSTDSGLKKSTDNFVSAVKGGDVDKVTSAISLEMALNTCAASFPQLLKAADSETQTLLRGGKPEDGLLRLLALNIINNYTKKKETLTALTANNESDTKGNATLRYNNKSVDTKWAKEDGAWKLASLSGFEAKAGSSSGSKSSSSVGQAREGFYVDDPDYSNGVDLTYGLKLSGDITEFYGARWWGSWRFFYTQAGLFKQTEEYEYIGYGYDENDYWKEQKLTATSEAVVFSVGFGGQVPLAINRFQIVPTTGMNLDLAIGDEYASGGFAFLAGSKFGYVLNNGCMPYLQLDYYRRLTKFSLDEGAGEGDMPSLMLVRVGWAF